MKDSWDRAMRSAFDGVRALEPTDDEVLDTLQLDDRRQTRRVGRAFKRGAVAVGVTLVFASSAYALPATRGALQDAYGTVTGWVAGGDGPGRALEPDADAPAWVTATEGERRVVAENGPAKLYAIKTGDTVEFALGGAVGLQDSVDGWRRQLAGQPIVSLGPGSIDGRPLDEQGRRPLFGLVADDVKRIELRYDGGQPSVQSGLDGGYVLLADAHRLPRYLVGFDAADREIARLDVRDLQLRVCTDPAGCPPGQLEPTLTDG